jgi:hypothetical protein
MHLFSIWEPSTDPSQQDFSPGVGFLFLFYFIFLFYSVGGGREVWRRMVLVIIVSLLTNEI